MADLDRAGARFKEQLRLCRGAGLAWIAAEGVAGLAAVAARQGEEERAARLLGAAESMANVRDDATGVKLEEQFFAPARKRIGATRWDAAYAEGARLGSDEVVSLALDAG